MRVYIITKTEYNGLAKDYSVFGVYKEYNVANNIKKALEEEAPENVKYDMFPRDLG